MSQKVEMSKLKSEADKNDLPQGPDTDALQRYSYIAGAVGLAVTLLVAIDPGSTSNTINRFASLLGIALGTSALMALLGFLFGMPRTLANDNRRMSDAPFSYKPSTNLEEISDWLTKMIIGVGLIQLVQIGEWLMLQSGEIAENLRLHGASEHFIIGAIVYFACLGFINGFLWTRLKFGVAIMQADAATVQEKIQELDDTLSQVKADQDATMGVNNVLDFKRALDVEPQHISKLIIAASPHVRNRIYWDAYKAQDEALESGDADFARDVGRRTGWVFSSLIEADPDIKHPNNYLDLALSQSLQMDWNGAEQTLNKIVSKRDILGDKINATYDLALAQAKIHTNQPAAEIVTLLEGAFVNEKAAEIWSDQGAAAKTSIYGQWYADAVNWMISNNIDMTALGLNSDGSVALLKGN